MINTNIDSFEEEKRDGRIDTRIRGQEYGLRHYQEKDQRREDRIKDINEKERRSEKESQIPCHHT